jgi:(p)ppGpp synthase/HD superfamily hydrolase
MMDNLVQEATKIAANAHADHFRKDGITPYIIHPWEVVKRVEDDPITKAVAWLHDTIEDNDSITAETLLEKGMPEDVVDAVELLTKEDGADYLEFVRGTMANPIAHKVKIADVLANMADDPSDEQIRKYAQALLVLIPEEQSATI